MQKLLSVLIAAIVIGKRAFANAQNATVASAQKLGTRVITLGTLAGPVPAPHRANRSNLLIAMASIMWSTPAMASTRRLAKANINIEANRNRLHNSSS